MLNVTARDGTIEKRLNKYGLSGKVARTKHLLSKKKMAAWLRVANMHPNKPHNAMCFGQSRQKWTCLATIHIAISGKSICPSTR